MPWHSLPPGTLSVMCLHGFPQEQTSHRYHPTLQHRLMTGNINEAPRYSSDVYVTRHTAGSDDMVYDPPNQCVFSPDLLTHLQVWPCISYFMSISTVCAQGRMAACLHKFQYVINSIQSFFSVMVLLNMFPGFEGPRTLKAVTVQNL